MADDFKIGGGGGGASGVDALKEALGMGSHRGNSASASGASSSGAKGGIGPRGMRMLAADAEIDQLDRNVPRGTYIDIVI